MLKWFALFPVAAHHPALVKAITDNLPEAEQFILDVQALATKHQALFDKFRAETPDAIAAINEAMPIIMKINAGG